MLLKNPGIYEINTRVWIKKISNKNNATLKDIPDKVWDDLAAKGFDIIWLMGIWKTCPSTIKKCCYEPALIHNYDKSLKDWNDDDVVGSPFAIDDYEINPSLGTYEDLINLKKKLNERGLKLFLDFIPNHFSSDSHLIETNPEIFLKVDEDIFQNDKHTFFKSEATDSYFAHGRDPFFPAWSDTIQINYFSLQAIEFMINALLKIAGCCDGVRCDMAMLPLNNVFYNTWSGVLNKMKYEKPDGKFWAKAISRVKEKFPDFIFIAEAYWDLEWELQQLGFDYTYDKKLTDRLLFGDVFSVKEHLMADINYQKKSIRFIENHDEDRALSSLGKSRSLAAAVIISTIPGMWFYYDGQMDGRRIKLPLQLGREPEEPVVKCIADFYDKLLLIKKNEILKNGEWHLLNTIKAWEGNKNSENILAWLWDYKDRKILVAVNYSDEVSQCRIKLDVRGYDENIHFNDLLNNIKYFRSAEEVHHSGLYIELKPYKSHVLEF